MKKQLIYFLLALTAVCLGACNNDDEIDTAHSIFSTEPVERNAFDDWLLDNYHFRWYCQCNPHTRKTWSKHD